MNFNWKLFHSSNNLSQSIEWIECKCHLYCFIVEIQMNVSRCERDCWLQWELAVSLNKMKSTLTIDVIIWSLQRQSKQWRSQSSFDCRKFKQLFNSNSFNASLNSLNVNLNSLNISNNIDKRMFLDENERDKLLFLCLIAQSSYVTVFNLDWICSNFDQ